MWVTTEAINSNLLKSESRIVEILAGTRNETVLLTENSIIKAVGLGSHSSEQNHGPSESLNEELGFEELL